MPTRLLLAASVAALAVTSLTAAEPRPAAGAPTRAQLYAAMTGRWQGTLEYKDYRDPGKRVTLPTVLEVTQSQDSASLLLRFTYDDGPGRTVYGSDVFALDAASRWASWGPATDTTRQRYEVASYGTDADATTRLVLEGEGSDDDKPATIRKTLTLGRSELRILKETRPRGGEFRFRNAYTFSQAK